MIRTQFEGKLHTVLPLKGRQFQIHLKSGCVHQSMQGQGDILLFEKEKKLDMALPLKP
jgi:hypothetical protein